MTKYSLIEINLLLDPVAGKNVNKTDAKKTHCHVEGYDASLK